MVDGHLKWVEVVEMPQTTTARTIAVLRHLFATHGIPEHVVSDNSPQFTSSDFTEFTKTNSIKHTRSSPYHPTMNGEAETFVWTFKHAWPRFFHSGQSVMVKELSFWKRLGTRSICPAVGTTYLPGRCIQWSTVEVPRGSREELLHPASFTSSCD